ncbi:MAG: Asp-tRNA(Asn)/Glu-tRNA(Gln) amidotransferase subunit GatA [Candidatus Staskawiczbacteria bacterium]|nr:Asp-tRNA(Asn)/Glu-tRNA(Gln) amidotransferase subunit GatA [Candidatus Staskawiczbacteria bacterium]
MELTELTIKQCHEGLKNKKFSSRDLTLAYLENIKKKDKELHAFLTVTEDLAISQAIRADERIALSRAEGQDFPMLCGIPCAIKDNILVEGQKCTNASKILENYVASYDATCVKKLKEQGVIILGKTNLDEFAFGSSTENSAFGVTKNPHDKTRVAGGSSGGSAAAVAANMACFTLGTDTGCSIRTPASFCGIVGLKPTYGAVSRYGLTASASSLDQMGPMAKNVEDCKIVFKAISGKDKMDATSADYKLEESEVKLKGIKIGVPKEYFGKGLDPEVEKIIRNAIKKAEDQGAEIVEINLSSSEYALACYYIIQTSEASANLARFDGIRYGRSENGKDLLDVYLNSRGVGFGSETKRRIMLGTYSLSSGYYDAYYKKAQEVRGLIRQDFEKAFSPSNDGVDLIFCPVTPFPAFKIGEKMNDPLSMYLADIYTVSVNLAGLPALSLPAGKIGKLPVGLQIIGNQFQENKILSCASELEKIIDKNV